MKRGIYTLANDAVYDQLVALLNSIEANYSGNMPVCVIPYDDNLGRVRDEIVKRPQVTLFDDTASIARWEEFAKQVWNMPACRQGREQGAWGVEKGMCSRCPYR